MATNLDRNGIANRLTSRNGARTSLIVGRRTNASDTVPTYGAIGANRILTHSSASMSRSYTPTGMLVPKALALRWRLRRQRASPV